MLKNKCRILLLLMMSQKVFKKLKITGIVMSRIPVIHFSIKGCPKWETSPSNEIHLQLQGTILTFCCVMCVQLRSLVSQLPLVRSPWNKVSATSLWNVEFLSVISKFTLCRVRQDCLSHSSMYIYLHFARKLNRLKNKKPS